ncbi:PREDICTED: uncharacterized protein LOC109156064 isoform X2 [Ipomoea nil]|uniref:uncharacterized protein LOC109156064 isoform X2 n=1 Tax=Ipomoea nil TaxID=35883 RepID=UPI000901194A|nr:PREDICTED: uncharacterized protein LOC109156064 isoform X2 [Ipomoea nil]
MWQVALGAAFAAGSGFLAKRLINPNAPLPSTQNDQESDQPKDQNGLSSSSFVDQDSNFTGEVGAKEESLGDQSIFRFSSSPGSERGPSKNSGCGSCRNKQGNVEGFKRDKDGRMVKKCGFKKGGMGGLDHRCSGSGKKFYVCLKKRRTSKTAPGKCESCSSNKGNSVFGWGLGIGMMCMMSARGAEINKLNVAMDETSKISGDMKEEHNMEPEFVKLCTENRNGKRIFGFAVTEEGEYASSVLTEELQPEAREMDELEAELESELQKLDGSGSEVREDIYENGDLDEDMNSYELNGVPPSELRQKLCQVLIEQQESQIVELESELQRSHRKLHEKETELQALKDCVRRLTDFSLGHCR